MPRSRLAEYRPPRRTSRARNRGRAAFTKARPWPRALSSTNLAGDGQADLKVHGGPDKAVCVYSADHYPLLAPGTGRSRSADPGWFGENFSVEGQSETDVAVGDTYRIGTAVVQISQPRAPCWKLGRRWNRLDMPKLVLQSGRTGWYLRVLETATSNAATR